jgi:uncharacterized membrane protein YeiH
MQDVFLVLEMIGVVAFAVSGAAAAIDKNTDIFGVMFLGITTALGGGVFRDVMLGYLPPRMFEDYSYVAAAIIASLLVFAAARIWRESYFSHRDSIDAAVNVFDAIGLGVFTISGMNLAIAHDGITNPLLVIVLGMATGIGGGMIRDTLIGEIPFVLRKRVYAVASLAGGCVYYLMYMWRAGSVASALTGISTVFIIRMLATAFKWSLPKIR